MTPTPTDPRPRRLSRVEKQAQTRAALLEAAAEVFVTRGFQGASVDAIAEAAGFSRGAFYSNFDTKEELFAELLQERVYSIYRNMGEAEISGREHRTPRETGEYLAAIQGQSEGRWMFRLWLELLAHAGRDEAFRAIAARFWSGNRRLTTQVIADAYKAAGGTPPADPSHLASAVIALDVGLALQHFVDPQAVPLDVYPEIFDALFGGQGAR